MNSWHIISTSEGTGYSIIQKILDTATADTIIFIGLCDGISFQIDGDSSIGLQEQSMMFQLNEEGNIRHVLLNTNHITHIEVIKK